ncbi:RNA polymerase sigma factor [Rugosimonospora acidiphila]|uniref:RNA polymerase sigma factor n=1 Tax=Rugosimonospora acidiphila TaxID=556531 RepID=A0ABP9RSP5_9ACTN
MVVPVNPGVDGSHASPRRLDPESDAWVRSLGGVGAEREAALSRLHGLLLRVARGELRRRAGQLRVEGPEFEDLAHQAADDALLAIVGKLGQFRAESQFTTWAYRFVVFEVSTKVGRHFWRDPEVRMDAEDWDRLPDRFGLAPATQSEWRELMDALRHAVDTELTDHQRQVFVALVLNAVPLDALVARLGTNRNAIYKTMFDARRKLRAALVAGGYLHQDTAGRS